MYSSRQQPPHVYVLQFRPRYSIGPPTRNLKSNPTVGEHPSSGGGVRRYISCYFLQTTSAYPVGVLRLPGRLHTLCFQNSRLSSLRSTFVGAGRYCSGCSHSNSSSSAAPCCASRAAAWMILMALLYSGRSAVDVSTRDETAFCPLFASWLIETIFTGPMQTTAAKLGNDTVVWRHL